MYTRKIFSAAVLLTICFALVITTSFAWFSLATAPEILGIESRIGSNGSLEVALLSDTTYLDPERIGAGIGSSDEVLDATASNLFWGNVVDLSDESYGLAEINMMPARLNISFGEEGQHMVKSHMLSVPDYGSDGRLSVLYSDTVSASYYKESGFTYYTDSQDYGVRGIGSIKGTTPQEETLALARSRVRSYGSAAHAIAESAYASNSAFLLDIYFRHHTANINSFSDKDLAIIEDTAIRIDASLGYLDAAMRQGFLGVLASEVDDIEEFIGYRELIEDTTMSLSGFLSGYFTDGYSEWQNWITSIESYRKQLDEVRSVCREYQGKECSWYVVLEMLKSIMEENSTYFNEDSLSYSQPYQNVLEDNSLTITGGVLPLISDFTKDFKITMTNPYLNNTVLEVTTFSETGVEIPHLTKMAGVLDNLTPVVEHDKNYEVLEDIYGFAIDLAFRCNAATDLLLQTEAVDRLSMGENENNIQGSGSYMEFRAEGMETEQLVTLMDAIRVAFLDNKSQLLGIAKPGVSSSITEGSGIRAPLYLYDYYPSIDGSISIGERKVDSNIITPLDQNTATIVSAVVWLDGDHVYNGSASATKNLTGVLNLQFAGSTELIASELELSKD